MTKFSLRYPLLWNFTTRHFIGRKVAQKFHFQGMHLRSFFHLLDLTASKGAYIAYGIYQPWKDFKEAFLHQFRFQAKKETYCTYQLHTYIDLDYEKIKTLFGRVLSFFFPAFWDDGGNFKGSFHKAIFLSNSKRCFEQKPISLLAGKEKVEGEESSPFFRRKKASFSGTGQSA